VEAAVRGGFDHRDSRHRRELLKQRVNDGGRLRLLGKWRNAGVREAGELSSPDKGTRPGGGAAPLLANIFLQHVWDAWCITEVQPRMKGRCFLTRFAEDGLSGCASQPDAPRVLAVLPKACWPFHPHHASRKDGVEWVQQAAASRALGTGQGDIRRARMYPLVGQNTPWLRGPQAEDSREAPPPVYARDRAMVSGEPPSAIDRAVSEAVCETAWR
jgi:hypothetical protein